MFGVVLACWIAAADAAPLAAGQPHEAIRLAPRFVPGHSSRYVVEAEFVRRRAERDDAPGTKITQSVEMSLETRAVDRAGVAVVRVAFDGLGVRVQRLDQPPATSSWEWTRAGGKPSTDGPDVASLAAANAALVESTIEVRVAADGSVRGVAGLERAGVVLAARGADAEPLPVLGVLTPGAAESFFEGFWRLGGVEGVIPEVAAGDRLVVSRSLPLIAGHQARADTTYEVERATAGVVQLTGRTTFEIARSGVEPDPADPVPRIIDQSGRATVTWDPAAGRLVRRTVERSLTWSASLELPSPREPIVVRDFTSTRVTVTLVPESPAPGR